MNLNPPEHRMPAHEQIQFVDERWAQAALH